MEQIKTRKEADPQYTWRLEDLYADATAWEADVNRVEQGIARVPELEKALAGVDQLLDTLRAQDEMSRVLEQVFVYAFTKKDEDTAETAGQAMMARAENLAARMDAAWSFLRPAILSMPEQALQDAMQTPDYAPFRHGLSALIRRKAHALSPREELLLAQAGEMANGFSNSYDMLETTDLRFAPVQGKELTHGQYISFLENKDRSVRREAFENYYQSFMDHGNTFASLYAGNVHKDGFYAKARMYDSSLAMKLDGDHVPLSVYDSLIDAIRAALPDMHRYLELRRKMLKLDRLAMYDVYVPIVPDLEWKVPYSEAVDMVGKAVAPLGEAYQKQLMQGFDQGWVDVYENRGKATGAYCISAYDVHPYVLMNYQNNVDSAFTLAHEMGHAMHSFYASKNQPHASADYSIFTAEVASTLNEGLLLEHLLKVTPGRRERMYLLNYRLEQFRTTVFRQVMFAEFEKAAHAIAGKNEPLTREGLNALYADLNRAYYGDQVEQDERIAHEWMRIPHFYRSFYVYQYATGFSAASALCEKVLTEGEPAAERVLGFLSSGGNDYPIEILRRAGVDLTTPQPVSQALDVFRRTLDEMEKLCAEEGLI